MRITILIGIILALIRIWMGFNIEPDSFHWTQAYKDTAHLFMGGLLVSAWIASSRWKWVLFWSLNIVEVAVAIFSRV